MNPFTSGLFSSIGNSSNQGTGLFSLFSSGNNNVSTVNNPPVYNSFGGLFSSASNNNSSSVSTTNLFTQSEMSTFPFKAESNAPIKEIKTNASSDDLEPLPEVTSTTISQSSENDLRLSSPKSRIRRPSISPGSSGQKTYLQRRLSKDKDSLNKPFSIKVINIPDELNNKLTLVSHFSQFGTISKSMFYEKDKKIIIHFNDYKTALKAKARGSKTKEGLLVGNILLYVVKTPAPLSSKQEGNRERKNLFSANLSTDDASIIAKKLSFLESRDKRIRLNIGKKGSRKSALVGTCPDMCPEKERYFREKAKEISVYECDPLDRSTPDHRRFVTNYSRSSADQEEPLPSDLRPTHVLKRTMLYLLAAIADLGEETEEDVGKLGRWFEFLWSRTRAIRKEITQQQLCDHDIVSILEKITRFHIYCSERLCEEDSHSFDPKINNDNLTKCLQTLREMYYDLRLKCLPSSPNETEFRGYMILMKLEDDSILNEVHMLSSELRESGPVTFAMTTYHCLRTNNYARFFKMVERADYLSACILHRYFSKMRLKALEVMIKAYCQPSKGSSALPLDLLCKQLKFETILEAQEFCSRFGLLIDALDNLYFERTTKLKVPDGPLPTNRAVRLIEKKRGTATVGEVLNGGPLSPPEEYLLSVEDSFTQKEMLIDDSSSVIDLTESPPSTPDKTISIEYDILADEILEELIDEFIRPNCHEICHFHDSAIRLYFDTFNDVLSEDLTQILQEVIKTRQLHLQEATPLEESLINEVVGEFLEYIVNEEMEICRREEIECREDVLVECYIELLCDVILDHCEEELEVEHIWDEEKQFAIDGILEGVLHEELFDTAGCNLLEEYKRRRYFKKWQCNYAYRKMNLEALYSLPAGPPIIDDFCMVEKLLGAPTFDAKLGGKKACLNKGESLLNKSTFDIDKEIEDRSLLKTWSPLFECDSSVKYPLISIVLPSDSSHLQSLTGLWYHWLVIKLSQCRLSTIDSSEMQQLQDDSTDSPSLLLCFNCTENNRVLKSFPRRHYCLAINCNQIFLDQFNQENVRSIKLSCEEKPSMYWNLLIEPKLKWLIARGNLETDESCELSEQTIPLREFVEEFFHANFYNPISQDYQCRAKKHLPHQSIVVLIDAYNRVVQLLETELTDLLPDRLISQLLSLPQFHNVCQNRPEILSRVAEWMNSAELSWPCQQRCLNLLSFRHKKLGKSQFSSDTDAFPWTDIVSLCTNDVLSNSKFRSLYGDKPVPIDLLWKLGDKPLPNLLPINDLSVTSNDSVLTNASQSANDSFIPNESYQTLDQSATVSKSFDEELLEMEKQMNSIRKSISEVTDSFNFTASEL